MEYKVSALAKGETIYSLGPSQLTITNAKKETRFDIPYSQVAGVKLMVSQGVYFAYVKTPQGKFTVLSRSITGVGRFKDNYQEYKEFIQAFHEKLADANPQVRLIAGSTTMFILGLILVLLSIAAVILQVGFGLRGALRFGLTIVIAVPLIILGRTKTYKADSVPEKYLP